jgi:hypothetical protein
MPAKIQTGHIRSTNPDSSQFYGIWRCRKLTGVSEEATAFIFIICVEDGNISFLENDNKFLTFLFSPTDALYIWLVVF